MLVCLPHIQASTTTGAGHKIYAESFRGTDHLRRILGGSTSDRQRRDG